MNGDYAAVTAVCFVAIDRDVIVCTLAARSIVTEETLIAWSQALLNADTAPGDTHLDGYEIGEDIASYFIGL
jgi:hypothetical protein